MKSSTYLFISYLIRNEIYLVLIASDIFDSIHYLTITLMFIMKVLLNHVQGINVRPNNMMLGYSINL